MEVSWTAEQRKVIELRDCNILVSAAAGSGKTAVLVERILSMLTDPRQMADIDRFLIVTFTNAAAGEMRDRIRAAIEKRLESDELTEAMEEHLQRQISLVSSAQITTIHSFCQYVIRNHFQTIDLDPGFRVADEGEQKLMQSEVLQALLEEQYDQKEKEFLYMADSFAAGRDDRVLEELIMQLYHFSMSFPWPKTWLMKCGKEYADVSVEEFDQLPWVRDLMELILRILRDAQDQAEEALRLCLEADGPYMYEKTVASDLEILEELLRAPSYRKLGRALEDMPSWSRKPAKKDSSVNEEKRRQVSDLRDQYKKIISDVKEEYFYLPAEDICRHMAQAGPAVTRLLALTCDFIDRYGEEKRKKNLCDFDDLEHFALEILLKEQDGEVIRTAVAEEFSEYYREIMIDEYQDSNLVQEMILNAVSGVPSGRYNIFMVGDVKQSIYRFRLARPELFMEKYESYSLEEGKTRRIDLHKNFRSRSQVLTTVNAIFEQIMQKDLGNVQYDEKAALYPGADYPSCEPQEEYNTEVLLVDADVKEETAAEENARELEAAAVGKRILELVGREQIWDKERKSYRAAGFGDIVILLRTISGWAESFAKILGEMGIPAFAGSRTGYFSAAEVQVVLSLLKLIDNPRQDIPMAAVVYSPIVGLSGEEMARIRSECRDQPFCEACMQREELQGFFRMLEEFREMAVYVPVHELLWTILDRTGYGAYAAAMPAGEQRKANLDMLIERAIEYENGSYHGLYNFVRYIENLHKYDVDFGEVSPGSEAENAVRLMSIHKSKGLEFPIVFVAGMGKQINQSDSRSQLILHADLGVGCDFVDPALRIKNNTLLKKMMKKQIAYENLGEELRVLYVAMTRAKEKLILSGTVSKTAGKIEKWYRGASGWDTALSFTRRAGAMTYWDWVIPALFRNQCADRILEQYGLKSRSRNELYLRDFCCTIQRVEPEELIFGEKERQIDFHLSKSELLQLSENADFDEVVRERLEKNLGFCYPYEKSREIPNKISVSEIKKQSQVLMAQDSGLLYEEPVPVPLIPEFLREERAEITGAARGTIYHKLMECLDYGKVYTEGIDFQMRRLQGEGRLTQEERQLIDPVKIERFLESSLAKRMAMAYNRGQLYRERQFVLKEDAGKLRPQWDGGETVLIQGIIDAYFIEDGEIVLVDYKTDFVKFSEASSLYEKYRIQLEYYEKALERLTGLRVKEKLIYSFCLSRVLTGD